ncbi:MAG: NADH-quinone oxidoreductase subunit C [Gammaproteobacteria bacterium]
MPTLKELISAGELIRDHRPWPRVLVEASGWNAAAGQLAAGRLSLSALWGEADTVHMALVDGQAGDVGVLSLACPGGHYPSVAQMHPPALRLERAIRDLFGLEPTDLPDRRPWLDHGRWGIRHPLGASEPAAESSRYRFLPVEGESLHQIPVGPVHAGIIEPGHFRFTASGETVVRLEERLGYTHKGIESLMTGADLERGARLAGRISGDSTVACAFAFARAVESALGCEVPLRAIWLRALMAELERVANHLGDIGAICNDAAFALMHSHCGILREYVLRTADACFGHRLMRDCIVPGGVGVEFTSQGLQQIRALVERLQHTFPALIDLYENTASLQDRTVGAGIVQSSLVHEYAAGGYVGRASGRTFDARRLPGYPPYDGLRFDVPVQEEGDVNARVWIRIREVEQSLALIGGIIDRLPDGPCRTALTPAVGLREGVALVEGFRGDVLVWLRLDGDQRIERCHVRDPSWFQWPLLEAAIEGNIVADFPLCNKSFNCSYSGHDV